MKKTFVKSWAVFLSKKEKFNHKKQGKFSEVNQKKKPCKTSVAEQPFFKINVCKKMRNGVSIWMVEFCSKYEASNSSKTNFHGQYSEVVAT